MKAHLARRAEVLAPAPSSSFKVPSYAPRNHSSSSSQPSTSGAEPEDSARVARLARESSERARAEALRARKKRELELGSETASSVGGTPRSELDYRDVYNVSELKEAREARQRGRGRHSWSSRRWDDDEGAGEDIDERNDRRIRTVSQGWGHDRDSRRQ